MPPSPQTSPTNGDITPSGSSSTTEVGGSKTSANRSSGDLAAAKDGQTGDKGVNVDDVEKQEQNNDNNGDKTLTTGSAEKTSDKAVSAHPPPPNGGFKAWLQVLGAFFLFFNSWGIINTFGAFQTYYQTTLLPDHDPSAISWIGTFEGFFLFIIGVIAGPIFDKGHLRFLIVAGTFCVVFGLMMTSISTEYYQIFLAQGVLVGAGCAFLFVPSIAIVATYFTSKRAAATGITASGGSIGSVIYPIMFRNLIDRVGFGWTTRTIAFIALAGLLVSFSVMRSRLPPPPKTRKIFDTPALREAPYLTFCFCVFFLFIGLYFPFFYLPTFVKVVLHESDDLAFYMLAIINAASMFGRIIPGIIADRIGAINTMVPCAIFTVILGFSWLRINTLASTIVFACLYGFFSGALVSIPPTIIATSLSPDISLVGTRLGMGFFFCGVGLLIGNPIAGALLDIGQVVFWKAQIFCAVMVLVAALFGIVMRVLVRDRAKGWKV
ncbi:hypothetical protein FQN55_000097 [Onygenales sp. PD_40]|nr:hypothetical protein FQN55_000097 [Onygenales sp. PD_40]KAK2783242.1 hypothetical protein FQN52_000343 [Onygenales sp. PD_12]KAK2804559.1 hypothetical protein FQN51_001760 [Onygenales sp. PD_10]